MWALKIWAQAHHQESKNIIGSKENKMYNVI